MQPGHIVAFRDRLWIVLPAEEDHIALRPLVGEAEDVVTLDQTLATLLGYTLSEERPQTARFPLPDPNHVADAAGARLLWQAARLLLRESAAPLRSLGRIAIRPRLLIAGDVGVGKTIEALLIACELWDRGEIRRLAVLCPPALCDQWQAELSQKCNLDAVVIRPGTLGQLERRALPTETIYDASPSRSSALTR